MNWMLCVHHGNYEQVLSQIERLKLAVDLYRPMVVEPVDVGGRIQWRERPAFFEYLFVSTKLKGMDIQFNLIQLLDYIDQLPLTPVILGNWIANITDDKLAEVRASVENLNVTNRLRANSGDFAATYAGKTVQITTGAYGGAFGTVLDRVSGKDIFVEVLFCNRMTSCQVGVTDVQLV